MRNLLRSIPVSPNDISKVDAIDRYIEQLEASAQYTAMLMQKSQKYKWLKVPQSRNLIVEASKYPEAANA